jgi:SAM-dependent methyltransferase
MDLRSDLDISRSLADDCARHICWMIGSIQMADGVLAVTGWALVTAGASSDAQFLVNGAPFDSVRFPLDSPDLGAHFFDVAHSGRARFECYVRLDRIPDDKCLRFEFVQTGDLSRARRTAWWYPFSQPASADLSGERISRVIGASDRFSFDLGGATLFNRIQDLLLDRFGLKYEDLNAVLDWGCGAGRLLSQFSSTRGPQIWGSDVDHDNLQFCREQLPFARCVVFPLLPPTDIGDATFDLIVGISVCTHLSEAHQALWMRELRRMSRPGGLVLLSVQGTSQAALYRETPAVMRELERSGFVTKGVNPRINDIIAEEAYYLDVIQTRAHIAQHWSHDFEVLDFIDGVAANQDLVVMRARDRTPQL